MIRGSNRKTICMVEVNIFVSSLFQVNSMMILCYVRLCNGNYSKAARNGLCAHKPVADPEFPRGGKMKKIWPRGSGGRSPKICQCRSATVNNDCPSPSTVHHRNPLNPFYNGQDG